MKSKDSHRFRLLYRLLDESGLDWLSAEIRSFAVAPSFEEVSNYQVEAIRNFNKFDDQIKPKLDQFLFLQDVPINLKKGYKDCIQYLIERIANLAVNMEGAVNFANEIGISNVQLGQEESPEQNVFEIILQLKDIEKILREMVI